MMKRIVGLAGLAALMFGGSLSGTAALARCGKDCRTLIRNDFRTCRTACGRDLTCRRACRDKRRADEAMCRAALNPVPPDCGRTSPNSTTTTTLARGRFVCTEVLGFSQTGMWFDPVATGGGGSFLPIVDPGPGVHWEFHGCSGGGIVWMDNNSPCWTDAGGGGNPQFAPYCTTRHNDPDRVLLTISIPSGQPTVAEWVADIQAEIPNIISHYPHVRQIILQPVVGGPGDTVCPFNGNLADPVHASRIAPTIDQAIAQVVAADTTGIVVAGMSPEVRTCADYADNTGHLCYPAFDACGTLNARGPIGTLIGDFYASF